MKYYHFLKKKKFSDKFTQEMLYQVQASGTVSPSKVLCQNLLNSVHFVTVLFRDTLSQNSHEFYTDKQESKYNGIYSLGSSIQFKAKPMEI